MIILNKEEKLVDDYVVFDLETTGLNPLESKIIEIGALKYKDNQLINNFSVLINPECDIPEIITNITGIDNETIKYEKTIKEVMPKFIEFIEDLIN